MASEPKTRPTNASVEEFLATIEPAQKRADARAICEMMQRVTGEKPVMWGPSIVGFGAYANANATGKPYDWPLTGFSPRKANLTLYITPGFGRFADLVAKLGSVTTGASCLYVRKLADIDPAVLETLVAESVAYMRETYPAP